MFTVSWNHYNVSVCIPGRAIISDSDGTDPCIRVYVVRCAWVPVTMPYLVR
jgi:hypothetical protein